MWVKHVDSGYVNLEQTVAVSVEDIGSGTWTLQAYFTSTFKIRLNGSWTTQAAASEALRELVDGVDSTTYGD